MTSFPGRSDEGCRWLGLAGESLGSMWALPVPQTGAHMRWQKLERSGDVTVPA